MTQICFNYRFIVVFFPIDYCPVYNTGANTLDTVPCNVSTGSCPGTRIWSNEIYKCKFILNYKVSLTISVKGLSYQTTILLFYPHSI